MLQDTAKSTGRVNIRKFDVSDLLAAGLEQSLDNILAHGVLVEEENKKNLIVTAGKNWFAGRMKDTSQPAQMSHMALGSGTTAPAAGNTALESELGRVVLDSATQSDNKMTYVATFPAGTASGAVTEAGIFNADPAGTMLARITFAVKNKSASEVIVVTWEITHN